MPALAREVLDYTRFYDVLGVSLRGTGTVDEGVGECPNCAKNKFYVRVNTGQFSCKSCQFGGGNGGGNAISFMKSVHESSRLKLAEGTALARGRSLLEVKTLEAWGAVHSYLTGELLLPAYNVSGVLSNLYRYVYDQNKKKFVLYSSPAMHQQLFGAHLFSPEKPNVWIAEGPWDGMVLWEILGKVKQNGAGEYVPCASAAHSVLKTTNVIAVPGAGTWNDSSGTGWAKLCEGKNVFLAYHSDHPRTVEGKDVDGAGLAGLKRVASVLANHPSPPETMSYVRWGESTQHDPDAKSGWDVRDEIGRAADRNARCDLFGLLERKLEPVPGEWCQGKSIRVSGGVRQLTLERCESWSELVAQWKSAMIWSPQLQNALAVMMATITSTLLLGDQVWMKIISPPSTGKTKLCDALSTNLKYIHPMSQLTGFHSGVTNDNKRKNDKPNDDKVKVRMSLIGKIRGKTVITKDADPLIQNPNKPQIMAEMRDIFDGSSSSEYRNGKTNHETGIYTTFLFCGTETLRLLDDSDAGQRFLDFVIVDMVTDDMEDPILDGMFHKMLKNKGKERTADADTQNSPELTRANQLTGGYVKYMRENANELTAAVDFPASLAPQFKALARFVSYMRARPSDMQKEEFVQREMAGRVQNQLQKLAYCLAAVMQTKKVDAAVMRIIRKVVIDTARGDTRKIVDVLMHKDHKKKGADVETIRTASDVRGVRVMELLSYLHKLGVVKSVKVAVTTNASYGSYVTNKVRWQVSDTFQALYQQVRRSV